MSFEFSSCVIKKSPAVIWVRPIISCVIIVRFIGCVIIVRKMFIIGSVIKVRKIKIRG